MDNQKIISIICIILIVVICIASVVMAIGSYDSAQNATVLNNLQVTSFSPDASHQCHMQGCTLSPTNHVYFILKAKNYEDINLAFTNEANFTVEEGSYANTNTTSFYKKDKYLVLTPQSNGTIRVDKEKVYNEYEITNYYGDVHCLSFSGIYCDSHVSEAMSSIRTDLQRALNQDFSYFWSCALAPYNILLTFILLALVPMCNKWTARKKQMARAYDVDKERGYYTSSDARILRNAISSCKNYIMFSTFIVLVGVILSILGCCANAIFETYCYTLSGILCLAFFAAIPDRIIVLKSFNRSLDTIPIK